jgi:hypothetical protein
MARGQDVVGPVVHAVVRSEKPEAVLQDEAAQRRAVVVPLEPDGGSLGRLPHVAVGGLQAIVVEIAEDIAVESVAARLRDHVDDAAGGAAVLGFIASRLDVDLLDELEVQLLALDSVLHVGRVDAVDEVGVLGARGAVDGQTRLVAVGVVRRGARHDLNDRGIVPARGQALDRALADVGADRRRGRVDHRRFGRDGDLGPGRGGELEVHFGRAVELDGDGPLHAPESLERRRDRVEAGRQERQPVRAVRLRDGRFGALQ